MTIWRTRFACWIPKATHTHTHVVCNTYCFSTAAIVRSSMLYVYTYIAFLVEVFTVVYTKNPRPPQQVKWPCESLWLWRVVNDWPSFIHVLVNYNKHCKYFPICEERESNEMQPIRCLLSIFYHNMFRASLCPSSGEHAAPHNHSLHNQCRTPYAVVHGLVLLMMGIMMPETCCDRRVIINIWLVASCWFTSLHYTFHDARSQEPKTFPLISNFMLITFLNYAGYFY